MTNTIGNPNNVGEGDAPDPVNTNKNQDVACTFHKDTHQDNSLSNPPNIDWEIDNHDKKDDYDETNQD